MILAKEQINRYLRHIIMPEISGPGQKKLLESSVFIYGESVSTAAPAIYYLAAAGIGSIHCQFADTAGFDQFAARIRDLNGDVSIGLADGQDSGLRIFLGGPEFIKKSKLAFAHFLPSVLAFYYGWLGGIQVFKAEDDLNAFLAKLPDLQPAAAAAYPDTRITAEVFSTCFLGALCALEAIKLILDIGETAGDFLSCNLFSMEFSKVGQAELEQTLAGLASVQATTALNFDLTDSKVLIVGTGGLGSPAAYALASAGVGTIGLVDYDTVEISNLNRQILHSGSRIGMPKVESAALFLHDINPQLHIDTYHTALNKENIYGILENYDLVIAAVDNFPDRFLLNDACFFMKKPMLDAGVLRFDGTCMSIITPQSHCYRCTLPDIPTGGSTPTCAESGVLGPLPGIMGFLQAAEAAKLLSGQGNTLHDRVLFLDGMFSHFGTIQLSKQSSCRLCGTNPAIHELQEYKLVCADEEDTDQE
ncbi:ThiF family adenylyltransferase [Sporomusa sphaeroides DSM 2875]|uniref:HesA/MoeB/ThiF family protein n=1 Tax=Sporomusa sphaeroides TaxID=47679 RepID=UPI0020301E29|nr:ThiF family adenylyltransferase [Sporomusa sphaeroides DSM 2875]